MRVTTASGGHDMSPGFRDLHGALPRAELRAIARAEPARLEAPPIEALEGSPLAWRAQVGATPAIGRGGRPLRAQTTESARRSLQPLRTAPSAMRKKRFRS